MSDSDKTPPKSLTEADENTFRNLMSRLREEDPGAFHSICVQTILAPLRDESCRLICLEGDSELVTSVIVVCKGSLVSAKIIDSIEAERINNADS